MSTNDIPAEIDDVDDTQGHMGEAFGYSGAIKPDPNTISYSGAIKPDPNYVSYSGAIEPDTDVVS